MCEDRRHVHSQRHLQRDVVTAEFGTDEGQHIGDDPGKPAWLTRDERNWWDPYQVA